MPFKSKAQQRLFFAAAGGSKKWKKGKRPNISHAMAKKWAEKTSDIKRLPEKKKSVLSEARRSRKRLRPALVFKEKRR